MNPGKIVDPPRMDDRTLFRYPPDYAARPLPLPVVLDWSAEGGLLTAVERCNDNGACRKSDPGVMCPSFRATADERHSTRGRANALRLALTGQLGPDALDAPEMDEAMALCISCKGCKRECPTGVDMARLKLEWLHRRNRRRGVALRERVLAGLPRSAPLASLVGPRPRRRGPLRPAARHRREALGVARDRPLPRWSRDAMAGRRGGGRGDEADVVLLVDTFSRWFEPEQARAAVELLEAAGHRVAAARPVAGGRPLCCGRTYLSAGMLDEARTEAGRLVEALASAARRGAWIVGLEPSCLFTLRDEIPALLPGDDAAAVGDHALLLEDLLDRDWEAGRRLPLADGAGSAGPSLLVHGHCHQKAAGATGATLRMLGRIPGATVREIPSGCCGMAGAFGYHAEHAALSLAMGELDLLPAVRAAPPDAHVVADGTSCRAQIHDATGRVARHAALVLREALAPPGERLP